MEKVNATARDLEDIVSAIWPFILGETPLNIPRLKELETLSTEQETIEVYGFYALTDSVVPDWSELEKVCLTDKENMRSNNLFMSISLTSKHEVKEMSLGHHNFSGRISRFCKPPEGVKREAVVTSGNINNVRWKLVEFTGDDDWDTVTLEAACIDGEIANVGRVYTIDIEYLSTLVDVKKLVTEVYSLHDIKVEKPNESAK